MPSQKPEKWLNFAFHLGRTAPKTAFSIPAKKNVSKNLKKQQREAEALGRFYHSKSPYYRAIKE